MYNQINPNQPFNTGAVPNGSMQYQPQIQPFGTPFQQQKRFSIALENKYYNYNTPIRMSSPSALSDGMQASRWWYIPGLLCFGIGAIPVYLARDLYACAQLDAYRKKVCFYMPPSQFDYNEFIGRLNQCCMQYGMTVTADPTGKLSIMTQKRIFDVSFNNNGTFSLFWRLSVKNALFAASRIKLYRAVNEEMGRAAFAVQSVLEAMAAEKKDA